MQLYEGTPVYETLASLGKRLNLRITHI